MGEFYKIQHLLDNVGNISKKYDHLAKTTGENFNIFSIMNMEWNEVYTHSAIIGELLNPKGSHNFGGQFLDSFVEILNKKFSIEIKPFSNLVEEKICERTINVFNDWENVSGGRIDIIIEDKKQILIIENKPSAKNQDYQLIRYYNYAKTRNKEFYILYLTLDEKDLGDEKKYSRKTGDIVTGRNFLYSSRKDYEEYKSTNTNPNNFYCLYYPITFKNDILEWIEKCIILTEKVPLISETLKQYRNNIKNITNQNINNKMSQEIKELITAENAESILLLAKEIEDIKYSTKNDFEKLLSEKIGNTKISFGDNEEITGGAFYDSGFYLGFQYFKGEVYLNQSDKGKDLVAKIKLKKDSIKTDKYFLISYVPKPFQENQIFENLDIKEILKMSRDKEYLEKIVTEIANEFIAIRDLLKDNNV
jgi:hypothetical protein